MPKILTAEAIEQYRRDGYFSPLAVLTAAEVSDSRGALESFEKSQGCSLQGAQKSEPVQNKPIILLSLINI